MPDNNREENVLVWRNKTFATALKATLSRGFLFGVCVLVSLNSSFAFTLVPCISSQCHNSKWNTRSKLLRYLAAGSKEGDMMDEYERQSQAFRQETNPSDFFSPKDDTPSPSSSSFPRRVKTRLNNLLSGMPSLSEMFRAAENGDDLGTMENSVALQTAEAGGSSKTRAPRQRRQGLPEDAWFQEEKEQIMNKYDSMFDEMLARLETQRKQDADSVPENAEALMKFIFKEEMERELIETRDKRANERIQTYGAQRMEQLERQDISKIEVTEDLQILLDETQDELERRQAFKRERDDFGLYEQEAFRKSVDDKSIALPVEGTNMDLWALDRLEEMAESKSEAGGAQDIVDMLEESADRLRSRLQRESEKGTIRTDGMKEFQMYRSIATRLAADDALLGEGAEDMQARQDEVSRRLEAWKAYVEKEESIREQLGLTRGPRLPFEFLGVVEATKPSAMAESVNRTKAETRKEINRMSVKALESLLASVSPSRRENLEKEIAYMKSILEPNDYLDVDEASLEERINIKQTGPVDLRGVFTALPENRILPVDKELASKRSRMAQENENVYAVTEEFETDLDNTRAPPPPPNTPFFSQELEIGRAAPVDSKLGDMEEQKLQSMFRKAGAWTKDEQDKIRRQYEEYRRIEDAARQKSGLAVDSEELSSDELAVNVSALIGDDGSIDADRVLQAIGPRPSRTQKGIPQSISAPAAAASQSSVRQEKITDSLYRTVSAVGGGRLKDNLEASAMRRTSYEEFIQKEKELRKALDEDAILPPAIELPTSLDDVKYAETVLNALGPRPQRRRIETLDEGAISDRGGILAWESEDSELDGDDDDDDDDDDVDATENPDSSKKDKTTDAEMPGWLRQESNRDEPRGVKGQLLSGVSIDTTFEDDQYDKRVQQLHEYEQRRGQNRQMGIEVSNDRIRRNSRNSDDYADYKFDDEDFRRRRSDWGDASSKARKESLLDFIELDAAGLNSLMDHKESVYSTGVSQYLPRVNKPFSCFGAIFRLEGVLVDLTGLQMKAWTEVADQFGFKAPEHDDVVRASVLRPEVAMREAFFWTNDVVTIRDATALHRKIFRELFDSWAKGEGIVPPDKAADALVIGADVIDSAARQASTGSSMNSWLATAEFYSKSVPSQADLFHAASLDPERAVMEAFRWTSDVNEASRIVETYNNCLKYGRATLATKVPEPTQTEASTSNTSQIKSVVNENAMMEIHYRAWQSVAEAFGLTPPSSDAVLSAFVINEPLMAVSQFFGWTGDDVMLQKVVASFREHVDASLGVAPQGPSTIEVEEKQIQARETVITESANQATPGVSLQSSDQTSIADLTAGPSQDEVFKTAYEAWEAVATKEGREPPTDDQVLFAMSVGPESAVVSGFAWANDFKEAARFVELYLNEISVLRKRWNVNTEQASTTPNSANTIPMVSSASGTAKWIKSLLDVEMSCAIVSFLESDQVEALLQYSGLAEFFPADKRVSSTSGYKDDVQQLLGAALRVERRPDHCVAFDSTPHASHAAHEVDMRSVNLIGHFPKYELLTADSTTASFAEMTAMDIRRLFSERVFDQPQTEALQPMTKASRKTITKSGFWEDE
ncbi:hypothetical protein MPSEU_000713900 [Mayamaea pseudoterrestris]|nr:hypothetical protein MPSEU_000713900 [Mayamaea pseudoterrestris]